MMGLDYFLSKPTKTWFPQIREKMEVKMRNYDFDKILLHHQQAKVFLYFYFLVLLIPLVSFVCVCVCVCVVLISFLPFLLISFVFICFFRSHFFFPFFFPFLLFVLDPFGLWKKKRKEKKSKVFTHFFNNKRV